jgi:energy-coupling factor transport system substrate-specific component
MRIRDIVIIGMMGAILIAVQVGLRFLPNIELVSLLLLLSTLVIGKNTVYIIYVFTLLEGLLYGFGLWWMNYLYVWTILFIIVMIFRKNKSPLFWAVVNGAFGLSFGALCSIPYFFMGGLSSGFAYWVSGIPFDLIHCVANFIITLVLFQPLYLVLVKLTKKTEHI